MVVLRCSGSRNIASSVWDGVAVGTAALFFWIGACMICAGGSICAGMNRSDRLDAGLNLLHATTPRGVSLSARQIAEACGVSRQAIEQIEQKAMRKLRWAVKRDSLTYGKMGGFDV